MATVLVLVLLVLVLRQKTLFFFAMALIALAVAITLGLPTQPSVVSSVTSAVSLSNATDPWTHAKVISCPR